MSPAEEVRAMFPAATFGTPCAPADIARAESVLGESLPTILHELYLTFDGFRGPTNATFFWSLFGGEGLVTMNQFYRHDSTFPQKLVSQCLFFGDGGTGPQWAFKRDLPGKIIRWDAEWGTDFEEVGNCPIEVWRTEKQMYDTIEDEM